MGKKTRQRRLVGFEDEVEQEAGSEPATSRVTPPANERRVADAGAAGSSVTRLGGHQVYVLDAHSLIYQVFHARGEMSGPQGQPVGAIHGFLGDILMILERRKPTHLLCAFDPPGDTFRHQIYDQYKAHREPMPLDLQLQIPNIHRFLDALGIPILAVPGYEADDVLATVASQVQRMGGECFLVTSDKDCRQLISDQVKIYNIRKDEVVDAESVIKQWGIRPDQVVDLQALWGDSTDNIPGVPGVGQKTAAQLLEQYDTLEGIFAHVEEISGTKRRENLRAGQDAAMLSRRLVSLHREVPVEIPWDAAHVGGIDGATLQQLCQEFGFRGISERLADLSVASAPAAWEARYETVDTSQGLRELAVLLARQTRIAIDTETTSTHPLTAEIVGFSFAWEPGSGVYIPVRSPSGERHVELSVALAALKPVLEDPGIEKVGQNLKYDLLVLRRAGVRLQNLHFDTMVADYLLAPGERNHALSDLAKRYLNHETIKISSLIGTGKQQKRMDQIPVALVTEYAGEDVDVPLRLAELLTRRLQEEGFEDLYYALEMPLLEVLAELEFTGIKVDVPLLRRLSEQYGLRMSELEQEIHALAGGPFNIESPKQLAHVLFDQLGLRVVKKTKTGPSTDAGVLSELAPLHPLPAKVMEYRQQAKLKNTYVDALPQLVNEATGRVHTSFKQDVAATGRLSSTDPNLQNIPVRTRDGREIRAAFIPGHTGWQLLCADYSQIELRVLAHFSQDEALLAAFAEDRDVHAQVASEVYAVPLEEVTPEMRRAAKAINFGVIYGQSAFGLSKSLSIEKSEAAEFIDAYFQGYPGVEAFMESILAQCRQNRYVTTALGRRRVIQGVRDPARRSGSRQRNLPERIAINTVIQGTAADLIKQAMIQVHHRMQSEQLQARMLLQIHDELVFEAPSSELTRLAALVVDEMSGVGDLSVDLKVDVKAGPNWAQCEPLGREPGAGA